MDVVGRPPAGLPRGAAWLKTCRAVRVTEYENEAVRAFVLARLWSELRGVADRIDHDYLGVHDFVFGVPDEKCWARLARMRELETIRRTMNPETRSAMVLGSREEFRSDRPRRFAVALRPHGQHAVGQLDPGAAPPGPERRPGGHGVAREPGGL